MLAQSLSELGNFWLVDNECRSLVVDAASGDVLEEVDGFFSEPFLLLFDELRAAEAVYDFVYCLLNGVEEDVVFFGIFQMVFLEPFNVLVMCEPFVGDCIFKREI